MRCLSKALPRRSWPRGSSGEFLSLDLLKKLETHRGGRGRGARWEGGGELTRNVYLFKLKLPAKNPQDVPRTAGGPPRRPLQLLNLRPCADLYGSTSYYSTVQRGGTTPPRLNVEVQSRSVRCKLRLSSFLPIEVTKCSWAHRVFMQRLFL